MAARSFNKSPVNPQAQTRKSMFQPIRFENRFPNRDKRGYVGAFQSKGSAGYDAALRIIWSVRRRTLGLGFPDWDAGNTLRWRFLFHSSVQRISRPARSAARDFGACQSRSIRARFIPQ